jgi:predicted MFS family arabinose efflux permease
VIAPSPSPTPYFSVASAASSLIAIQVLDGIAAALFGVVSVLVYCRPHQGDRPVQLDFGVVTTAVGVGAALSQSIAGGIVHRLGYHAGFLFLAAIAAAALILLWTAMPETRNASLGLDKQPRVGDRDRVRGT